MKNETKTKQELKDKIKNQVKLISEQEKLIEFLQSYYRKHCESTESDGTYLICDVLEKYDEVFRLFTILETKDIDIGLSRMKQTTELTKGYDQFDKVIRSEVYVNRDIDENLFHEKIRKITCKNENSNGDVVSTETFEMKEDFYDYWLQNSIFHEKNVNNRLIISTDNHLESDWLLTDLFKYNNETKFIKNDDVKMSGIFRRSLEK